uniref:Sigma-54 dependent DNA-binding response regulator Nla24 n=1 Tax=uncultured prokaryote TaxID=198431 RepID=H5S945_9ZZZZ|nr:sigma-54 dependent DNA-binding response regulator Nla24 [uncultured prokaryote]
MLRVIILQKNNKLGESLGPLLEDCKRIYNIQIEWKQWNDLSTLSKPSEPQPTLWIVEAPGEDTDTQFVDLLTNLDKTPKSWVYVVSPREQFDSSEAGQMWLRHRCVINYDLLGHLTLSGVRNILHTLLGWATSDQSQRRYAIGQWLKLAEGEYEQQKFLSLFLGGMRSVILEVRQFLHLLEREFPPLRDRSGCLNHPFLNRGKLESPQDHFDKIVGKPGHTLSKSSRTIPEWMQKLQEERRTRGYTLPHLLISGETGTGKTLLARFLHHYRFKNLGEKTFTLNEPEQKLINLIFQELNCGAVPEKLIDGELFGGCAGAWSDLHWNTPGKIFSACLGTLFLDEISSLPLESQATLLKYLDDQTYTPIGWHGERFYIPTVVIAATNQDLEQLVAAGRFRQDLYERFRFRVRLPSLRERRDHFDALIDFVLQNPTINPPRESQREVNFITEEARQKLYSYTWPGNFRELEQVLWKAVRAASLEGLDVLLARHIQLTQGGPYE